MGITGLLPLMSAASTDVQLSRLKDTVAAVDTNGWIHRACYSCADKIYLNEPTEMYINYCLNYCKLLRKHSITPILVFDGQSLPAKSETKLQRQQRKQKVRETIEELLRTGRNSQARWLMKQCVDVTFEMIRRVIERCRQERIDYLVAPYEADAQITYLVNSGLADYAITEDSDLLAFGCRRALYKLDREAERGRMINLDHLHRCFSNLDLRKFQLMCILSGCDYLENIRSVGIGRARKFFESIKDQTLSNNDSDYRIEIPKILKKIPETLKMVGKLEVTDEYVENFLRACNTFDHQLVYSPQLNKLIHLNPLKRGLKHSELKTYAGDFFNSNLISKNNSFLSKYIRGDICPKTLKLLSDENIENSYDNGNWYSSIINQRIESKEKTQFDPQRIYFKGVNSPKKSKTEEKSTIECKNQSSKTFLENKDKPTQESTKPKSLVKQSKQIEQELMKSEQILDNIRLSQLLLNSDEKQNYQRKSYPFTTIRPSLKKSQSDQQEPSSQCYTRNMFRKSCSLANDKTDDVTMVKSSKKYFQNEQPKIETIDSIQDDSDLIDHCYLVHQPLTKRQKTSNDQTNNSLNISTSSSLEEDVMILKELNESQFKKNEYKRRSSLSSASQSSQSSTNTDDNLFRQFQMTQMTPLESEKKQSTSKKRSIEKKNGKKSPTNNSANEDIRKYFSIQL